jgi:hypothetical protein
MAKQTGIDELAQYLNELDHPLKPEIEALRAIVAGVDSRLRESIKWNAPSFALDDHFATFKLRPPTAVQIVLHTGAKVKEHPTEFKIEDAEGLLKWAAPDRALLTFRSMQEVEARRPAVEAILKQWIAQL